MEIKAVLHYITHLAASPLMSLTSTLRRWNRPMGRERTRTMGQEELGEDFSQMY